MKHVKRFLAGRKAKKEGHPRTEDPEPTFLFDANADQPCDLCGYDAITQPRRETHGVVWVCLDALSCLRRQNLRSVGGVDTQ